MIEQLLIYQEADAKLRKIETELSSSEDRKKAISAKKFLEGVEETVNNLDARAKKLVEEFEAINLEQQKLKEQETELYKVAENPEDENEASYLIKKLEELMAKMKILASKANEISDAISAVCKEYVQVKSQTKAAQTQYAESGKKYNDLKASLQSEKDAIEKELAILKGKVEVALMEKYLKKRAMKMYPIVYEVKSNVCAACNMELPMSEMNKLKGGAVVECDQCGRLLFMKN